MYIIVTLCILFWLGCGGASAVFLWNPYHKHNGHKIGFWYSFWSIVAGPISAILYGSCQLEFMRMGP